MAKFLSATWPIGHLVMMAGLNPAKPPAKLKDGAIRAFAGKPYTINPIDHVALQLACIPKFFVALAVWHTYSVAGTDVLSLSWILPILLRDLAILWATAGLWDAVLYSQYSPFKEVMRPFKFNSTYPKLSQFVHDIFWSNVSAVMSTAFEVVILYYVWSHTWTPEKAAVPWYADWRTVLWLLGMPYWRIAHFYCVHRVMHAWKIPGVPDVGYYLYRYVHSLHHLSKNPIAWSGVSMHPVESFMYYTAMLIPVLAGAHPLVVLYTKFDLTMAALIGHDGFGSPPGGGSQAHYLHHALMDVNFGESYVPIDWFMGTFVATEEEYLAKQKAKAASGTKKSK